jgi:hypothetical protein
MSITEKLQEIGINPVVPLPICAQAAGVSQQTLKKIAARGELEIIRVSERRCGIRRSVLDAFLESRQSAVTVTGKSAPARFGNVGKRERVVRTDV